MKKKITALFLCVALAAIAIVGASLAYFTDTDKIDLTEQQSKDHTALFLPIREMFSHRRFPASGVPLSQPAANYIDNKVVRMAACCLDSVTMRFPPI